MSSASDSPSLDRRFVQWLFVFAGVALVLGIASVGFIAYFFGPTLAEKAIEAVHALGELSEVQARLSSAYPGEQVHVSTQTHNGATSLTISIVNSELVNLAPDEKRSLAYDAAKLAFETYPESNELTHIAVVFTKFTDAGMLRITRNTDCYEFDPEELNGSEPRAAFVGVP